MKFLFVLHDPPYGIERTYNGLRWARQMLTPDAGQEGGNEVRVFLFGDAVIAAMAGQKTPDGFYNTGTMLKALAAKGVEIGACGTCMDGRGLTEELIVPGTHRSSMAELGAWTAWADQVINI